MPDIKRGDFVSWNSSGGRARGKVVKVVKDGLVDGIPVKITGTEEEPAAKIKLYRKQDGKWFETGIYIGHKLESLTKIKPISTKASRLKKISLLEDHVSLKVKHSEVGEPHYYIYPSNLIVQEGRSADDVIAEALNLSLDEYRRFMRENGAYDGSHGMGVDFETKEEAEDAIRAFIMAYDREISNGIERKAKKITDFPTKGENQKISLRNSRFPQFDWDYAMKIKEEYPEIWKKGGNIRGNEAFNHWTKARDGKFSPATLDWIKEREAWMARHKEDFRIAGVVAVMKWGGICSKGMSYMKKLINEEKKKINEKKRSR